MPAWLLGILKRVICDIQSQAMILAPIPPRAVCRRTASSYGIPVIFGDMMTPCFIRDLDTESPVSHHVHAELDELLSAYGIEFSSLGCLGQ